MTVYSVVLDLNRNQACSGSMDGTVRVWNLGTGQCVHTLAGHTSLVGLLGLSPSYLVSAAADSTLRIWDPDTGDLRHTLAAHTGAITCFQHDEFKVLSGSDGTLKMWDIRDGTFVRDLLTGINGVWQVVFEGRWCVAASNRLDATMLDVWDFGREDDDDDWIGEPAGGLYDDTDEEDAEEDVEQADVDAMDQDLEVLPSEQEPDIGDSASIEDDDDDIALVGLRERQRWVNDLETPERNKTGQSSMSRWGPFDVNERSEDGAAQATASGPPNSIIRNPRLPLNEDTPTRPRNPSVNGRRR